MHSSSSRVGIKDAGETDMTAYLPLNTTTQNMLGASATRLESYSRKVGFRGKEIRVLEQVNHF